MDSDHSSSWIDILFTVFACGVVILRFSVHIERDILFIDESKERDVI